MRADFAWFRRFLKDYNGRAIVAPTRPQREIWADACLKGGGATDGTDCYTYTFPKATQDRHHITHLEAINCLAAARTLTRPSDKGGLIIVNCDNQPAVDAYRGGRAVDPVLAACARAMWFLSANNQVEYQFKHIPGELVEVPDALSMVMLSSKFKEKAEGYIKSMGLSMVQPHRTAFMFSTFYF